MRPIGLCIPWVGDTSQLLSFAELTSLALAGSGGTVLVCMMDRQGRLMGKRFQVLSFPANDHEEPHCCNYLLTTDLEMATPDGYAATSWKAGCGDYVRHEARPFDASADH